MRSARADNLLGRICDCRFRIIGKFLPAVAGDIVLKSHVTEFRLFRAANIDGVRTTGLKSIGHIEKPQRDGGLGEGT